LASKLDHYNARFDGGWELSAARLLSRRA
jgi:hypothetical protein